MVFQKYSAAKSVKKMAKFKMGVNHKFSVTTIHKYASSVVDHQVAHLYDLHWEM